MANYESIENLGPDGRHADSLIVNLGALPEAAGVEKLDTEIGVDISLARASLRWARLHHVQFTGEVSSASVIVEPKSELDPVRDYHPQFPLFGRQANAGINFSLTRMANGIKERGEDPASGEVWARALDARLKREIINVGTENLLGTNSDKAFTAGLTAWGAGFLATTYGIGATTETIVPEAAPVLIGGGILLANLMPKAVEGYFYAKHHRSGDIFRPSLFYGSQLDRAVALRTRLGTDRPLVAPIQPKS